MNPSNIEKKGTACLKLKNYNLKSTIEEERYEALKDLVDLYGSPYLREWTEGNELLRYTLHTDRETAKMLLINGSKVDNKFDFSFAPLHHAAICGDIEIAEMLLNRNANIEAKDRSGQTSLHYAIMEVKIEMIKLLLNRKAFVDASDRDGKTPLHYAIETGSEEIIKLVLQYNPNVNIMADCGAPLHIAVKEGNLQIVSDLLNQGAYINSVCTSTGCTPLHVACTEGRVEIARLLLLEGADINAVANGNLFPLYMATKEGHSATVKLLLEHGADANALNEDGETALCCAIERRYSRIAKEILKHSVHLCDETISSIYRTIQENNKKIVEHGFSNIGSKDINNWRLLHIAVEFGYLFIVENLFFYGANVNMVAECGKRQTLLHTAAIHSQTEVAHYLIKCGADVNAKNSINRTPLFYAVKNRNLAIIKLLSPSGIGNNTDVFKSREGCSLLLQTAVENDDVNFLEVLLENNISVNCSVVGKETALYISAQRGNETISRILLNKGARVNEKNEFGETALYIASRNGHAKIVEMLLEHGAAVNSRNNEDETPLFPAIRRDNLKIVDILIKFGADVNARDDRSRTALQIAYRLRLKSIILVLLQSGSNINIMHKLKGVIYLLTDVGPSCKYNCSRYIKLHERKYFKIIVRHIGILMAKKLFVHEIYLQIINANLELKRYFIRCEREIQKMKNEEIYNTSISFYNILVEDIHQLSIYANNENIVKAFESSKYTKTFPLYANVLEYQFKKGQERQCFLESSIESVNSIFGRDLPHLIVNKIFSYLSYPDLKKLITACQSYM